jgi:hypothetical protein
MNVIKYTILILLSTLLLACNDKAVNGMSAAKNTDEIKVGVVRASGNVLATIDGVEIRESQLNAVVTDMFGQYKASQMDIDTRRKALDSMLASYALSQQAMSSLTRKRINKIEEKTRRYRENLLVNAYIQTKMDVGALSNEKIKSYYENNIKKFSGNKIKEYQLLTTREVLAEEVRDKFLSAVAANKNLNQLQKIKDALEQHEFDMLLQTGELDKEHMDKRLYAFINTQLLNKVSEITFIDSKPYTVVVTSETIIKTKSFTEVKDTIRKNLVLKQLKKVLKEQSADVIAKSNIVYRDR